MKIAMTIFSFLLVVSTVFAQPTDELKLKVAKHMTTQYSDAIDISIDRMEWGTFWTGFKTKENFETLLQGAGLYDELGNWVENKFTLKGDILDSISNQVTDASIGKIKRILYIEGDGFPAYYKVEALNGRVHLMNENFYPMKYGPLKNGVKLTRAFKKDMNGRMDSLTVLGGWMASDSLVTFDVIFKAETYFQQGRISYEPKGNWFSSSYYMMDYTKLPLELIIFVDERGGLENFHWIEEYKGVNGMYYGIQFRDGTGLKLSDALMVIE